MLEKATLEAWVDANNKPCSNEDFCLAVTSVDGEECSDATSENGDDPETAKETENRPLDLKAKLQIMYDHSEAKHERDTGLRLHRNGDVLQQYLDLIILTVKSEVDCWEPC